MPLGRESWDEFQVKLLEFARHTAKLGTPWRPLQIELVSWEKTSWGVVECVVISEVGAQGMEEDREEVTMWWVPIDGEWYLATVEEVAREYAK